MRFQFVFTMACLFVFAIVAPNVCAEPVKKPYPFKDIPFEKATYDQSFFSNILLEKDTACSAKYEAEYRAIKQHFPESVVTPFAFSDLPTLDAAGKTVIIVFKDHADTKLQEFLERFLPIQPFAGQSKEEGTVISFTHVGENGAKFLIVKQAFDFQSANMTGKGLGYVANFLSGVAKVSSYKSRFKSYKPSDNYSSYKKQPGK